MSELIGFIERNAFLIFLFFLAFSGGIAQFIFRLMDQRHKRKLMQQERAHELAVLVEKRKLAEASGDAIKLLITDDALGADFNRRLRVALEEKKVPAAKPAEEEVEAPEERDAPKVRAAVR